MCPGHRRQYRLISALSTVSPQILRNLHLPRPCSTKRVTAMMYLTSRDLRSIAVLFLSCVACVMAKPAVTRTLAPLEAPVIGILAQATPPPYGVFGNQYIEASYVKYLEMAGARVVTIRGYQTDQYYHTLFDKVLNGVLLPGGMVDIVTSEFARVSKIFYNLAIQANDRGDYFPVWGTCQGFEQLTQLTSGKNLLTRTDSMNMAMSLLMASGWNTSRLLGKAPNDVMKSLQSENVTANFHDWSLLLEVRGWGGGRD
ncbi:gamma-glutamyl hydrolase, partial [Aplysia californica]|uniref:folate gamma-glutamyl hydrolase n=1 Tax=Aplysia californica TaxID=6500 RepID=A0ABM0ZZA5_APLCA